MVSMDNCSHNGSRLYEAVAAFARAWEENGTVKKGFLAYVNDKEKVSFPWTMIDKITPRPDPSVKEILEKRRCGAAGSDRHFQKIPMPHLFVNAEECEYLVIEDAFPNGRPDSGKRRYPFHCQRDGR